MFNKLKHKVKSKFYDDTDSAAAAAQPQIQFSLRKPCPECHSSSCADDCPSSSHSRSSHPPRAPKYYSQPLAGQNYSGELSNVNVLGNGFSEVREKYILGGELGRGLQGVTRMCTDRETGQRYACKSIAKHLIRRKEHAEAIITEVRALELLANEPSITGIKNIYEDQLKIHLVMELCEGGDLFTRIKERRRFAERESALVIKQIAKAIKACHSNGIVHRDLKPENILLLSRDSDVDIKLADFGVAAFIKPGESLTTVAGSPYYVAPEVLNGLYGLQADVWSAGVVLHILLSGRPPFWHRDLDSIFRAIREAEVSMSSPVWKTVSSPAKDLVLSMLTRDPSKRITPSEILEHPWLLEHSSEEVGSEKAPLSQSSSDSSIVSVPSSECGYTPRRGSSFGSSRMLNAPLSPSTTDIDSSSFGICTSSSSDFNWISFDQVNNPSKDDMMGMIDKDFRDLMLESKAHYAANELLPEDSLEDYPDPLLSDIPNHHSDV